MATSRSGRCPAGPGNVGRVRDFLAPAVECLDRDDQPGASISTSASPGGTSGISASRALPFA